MQYRLLNKNARVRFNDIIATFPFIFVAQSVIQINTFCAQPQEHTEALTMQLFFFHGPITFEYLSVINCTKRRLFNYSLQSIILQR